MEEKCLEIFPMTDDERLLLAEAVATLGAPGLAALQRTAVSAIARNATRREGLLAIMAVLDVASAAVSRINDQAVDDVLRLGSPPPGFERDVGEKTEAARRCIIDIRERVSLLVAKLDGI